MAPSLSTLGNGLLVCSTGYAMYSVTLSKPYAFTACAYAFCHGIYGIYDSLSGGGGESKPAGPASPGTPGSPAAPGSPAKEPGSPAAAPGTPGAAPGTPGAAPGSPGAGGSGGGGAPINWKSSLMTIMDLLPLPLVNMELYLKSTTSSSLALGHGLFIVPLTFDFVWKMLRGGDEDAEMVETLKDLTILGNILSLVFLAVNENNYLYGHMALWSYLSKYLGDSLESSKPGYGELFALCGESVFFLLAAQACSN